MIPAPPPTPTERFWRLFERDPETSCWNWTGVEVGKGYGRFYSDQKVLAHRFAYELLVEPIAPGMTIDHLCRNRRCVNPLHLEVVPFSENMRRALPFRRTSTKYSDEVVAEVRRLRSEGRTTIEIAALTGMEKSYVSRVARGLSRAS